MGQSGVQLVGSVMGRNGSEMGQIIRPPGPQAIDEHWHHRLRRLNGDVRTGAVAWSCRSDRASCYLHSLCVIPKPIRRVWLRCAPRSAGLCCRANRACRAHQGLVDACIVLWCGHRHWACHSALFSLPALWSCRAADRVRGFWDRRTDRFACSTSERYAAV